MARNVQHQRRQHPRQQKLIAAKERSRDPAVERQWRWRMQQPGQRQYVAMVAPEERNGRGPFVLANLHAVRKSRRLCGNGGAYGRGLFELATTRISATRGAASCLLLLLLMLTSHADFVHGEGNVGCKFVRTLCLVGREICYDDNIFGKCIPMTGVDIEDIEKTPLNEDQSRLLAAMLEELQGAGLGWDHPYVQCMIQGTLFSLQRQMKLPPNLCANLAPTPPDFEPVSTMPFARFVAVDEDYVDQGVPSKQPSNKRRLTVVRADQALPYRNARGDALELEHYSKIDAENAQMETPTVMDAFLDTERQRIFNQELLRAAERDEKARQNGRQLYQILAESEPDPQPFEQNTPSPALVEQATLEEAQPVAVAVGLPPPVKAASELYAASDFSAYKRSRLADANRQRSVFRQLAALEEQASNNYGQNFRNLNANSQYPSPKPQYSKRRHWPDDELQRRRLASERHFGRPLTPFEEAALLAASQYKPDNAADRQYNAYETLSRDGADNADASIDYQDALLADLLGFRRHERLDVKKPGPIFGTQTFYSNVEAKKAGQSNERETKQQAEQDYATISDEHSAEDHAPHSVDTSYTHVFVKNGSITNWADGVRIMNELGNILHLQNYFNYLTVQPNSVAFRVDSNNPEHKTAADVARSINENRGVRNNLLRRIGVTVLYAGVGDRVKADMNGPRVEYSPEGPDMPHIMAYMFTGAGVAAVVVIFIALILVKRNDKRRDKLGGLQADSAAAESCSKDYQELCRARMAGKASAAEAKANQNAAALATLNKENERAPSTRSSTSSWSEEPILSNMDISTGHMVLSYMENHLHNKGRLQSEWDALCRYEAEPSTRDAAMRPECRNLNRVGAPLPYDHSRVVLNLLANADGLDYINASIISDHDPRAPAYIAAQAPLPSTLAHFWQMIWEQGAIVIVVLCRLQENNEVVCARYWPEEGAETYHIYEVHLVSEHVWCDEFLVRSFYLKNLRTSESRTVTQFHFLAWPQGGIPANVKMLLDFRRKVNKSYRGRSCPIVVHGSTGAGRTGSYILLDLVLNRLSKSARELDISATLEHLRDLRMGMVASRQQFEFVLTAVAEEVQAVLKTLPAKQDSDENGSSNGSQETVENAKDKDSAEKPAASAAKTLRKDAPVTPARSKK